PAGPPRPQKDLLSQRPAHSPRPKPHSTTATTAPNTTHRQLGGARSGSFQRHGTAATIDPNTTHRQPVGVRSGETTADGRRADLANHAGTCAGAAHPAGGFPAADAG